MQGLGESRLCDCETFTLPPPVAALALHSGSRHVARRVRFALDTLGIAYEPWDDAVVVRDAALGRLDDLLAFLSVNERAEAVAAPLGRSGIDPWRLAPLQSWAARVQTSWLHDALRNLRMYAQPIVSVADGTIHAYEALLRSEVHDRVVGAADLLAASSAHGQLRALDAAARTAAIHQVYPHLPEGARLFINFAPSVVYNPDICLQTTFEACRATGADFSRLVFEVTESEAFPDLGVLRGILDRYRREGARVALDDLGAGYTSLTYLEELRPDVVKLDRGLVRGIQPGDPRVGLLEALVRYAHRLGVRVVIEGIETEAELRIAVEVGADLVQGYLFARPGPDLPRPASTSLDLLGALRAG